MFLRFRCLPALLGLALLTPAVSAQAVQVRLDAGTFAYSDDESLLEVYLSFGASSLSYAVASDGTYAARIPVRLTLRPTAAAAPQPARRAPVLDRDLELQFVVADTAALGDGQVFVEQLREAVAPGEYELSVAVEPAGQSAVELRRDVQVPAYEASTAPALSSVQLANRIVRADGPGEFVKSGLEVTPNPDAFYGGAVTRVPYYAEVYRPPAGADGTYTLLVYLAETNEATPLPDHSRRLTRAARPVDVVVGTMDVADLPSGIYYLRMALLNDANEALAEQSKRLYVINPDVAPRAGSGYDMDHEAALYAAMGEEELRLNLEHARVIASSSEQGDISRLLGDAATDEERRDFLAAFWRERDSAPSAGENRARRTFYERLALVNDRFREGSREGYKTDRGRVYLTYGPPTEIDRQTFNSNTFPYEVWTYDNIAGQGRSIFVFMDRYTAHSYELIHSSVVGEIQSPDWQQEVLRR